MLNPTVVQEHEAQIKQTLMNETKSFASYLKVVPAQDATMWCTLTELAEAPGIEISRLVLPPASGDRRFFRTWVRIVKA